MFKINFNPLCSWFNHLFLPFCHLLLHTHSPDIWCELHLPFFAGLKSSHLPISLSWTSHQNESPAKMTPEHATLCSRDGRAKQTQQLQPSGNHKRKSEGKWWLYPLPHQIQTAWERHLGLLPPPFMFFFVLVQKISFGRFAAKKKYCKTQKLL